MSTFLQPFDGRLWCVAAFTTPGEAWPNNAPNSTTPTSPTCPVTGRRPPMAKKTSSLVLHQAALSSSPPGPICRFKRDSSELSTTTASRHLTPPMPSPPSSSTPSTLTYPHTSNLRSASVFSLARRTASRWFVISPIIQTTPSFPHAIMTTMMMIPPTSVAALPQTPRITPKKSPCIRVRPSHELAVLGRSMGLFRNTGRCEDAVFRRQTLPK